MGEQEPASGQPSKSTGGIGLPPHMSLEFPLAYALIYKQQGGIIKRAVKAQFPKTRCNFIANHG